MNVARRFSAGIFVLSLLVPASGALSAQKLKDADCLTCHADPTLTTADANGATVSLTVDENKFKHSVHGRMFACVDCHKDVKSLAHEKPPEKVSCAQCHADAATAYAHSTHAKASKTGKNPAATCEDCHGDAHQIEGGGDPKSPVNHANIPATCGRCHGQAFLMESNGESTQPYVSYQASVHGRAVANGSQNAAVCTDCHGTHEILPANDSEVADLEVCRLAHLRRLPRGRGQHIQREHSRPGARSAAMRLRPPAPIATASTPSRRTPIPMRKWRSRMFRAISAPVATKACGFRRSSACRATA